MRKWLLVLAWGLALPSALLGLLLLAPGGLRPEAWQPPPALPAAGVWAPNQRLDAAAPEQTGLAGPDTVVPGADGYRYTAVDGGRVLRWRPEGPREEFVRVEGRPVGLNFGADGSLYGADELYGRLWKITPERQVQRLADSVGGRRFNFLNDVWIAADGSVYFSESTRRWSLRDNPRAMIEHAADGGVYVWRPDGRVEPVLEQLYFPNGVVLSPAQDYLLVAETGAYRISRYWLGGPRAGQREVLLDRLPGFPGDLSLAPDGQSYWGSLLTARNPLLDRLGPKPWLRALLGRLPLAWLPPAKPFPYVFRFDGDGRVLETLQASPGSPLPTFSSVVQDGDSLLLGTAGGVGAIDSDRAYRLPLGPHVDTP
jgi:sugar lactone lactonase YvrE